MNTTDIFAQRVENEGVSDKDSDGSTQLRKESSDTIR